jgi:hypothetical protein
MKESTSFRRIRHKRRRGQSLVEFALMAPILLIILSGLFEFGFIFNHYLAVLDAARNASRFSSDNWFTSRDMIKICDDEDGGGTKDFYRQAACLAVYELEGEHPSIELCLPPGKGTTDCPTGDWSKYDDVIISVFSVWRDGATPAVKRFPTEDGCPQYGWSYASDLDPSHNQCDERTGLHASRFQNSDIIDHLEPGAPSTGFVLVEINNHYNHVLGLPWFTEFVGDPIKLYIYALWPLVSAEPTSTPKPT